jgi:uncharacterized protein
MKIRSITFFCDPGYPLDEKILQKAGKFLAEARSAYQTAGYEVQTVRLATIPFPNLLGSDDLSRHKSSAATPKQLNQLPKFAEEFEQALHAVGIRWASLGPALPDLPRSYEVLPEAIAAAENLFYGGVMADTKRGLDLAAIRACAEVIVRSANIKPNGFANLQFAALANVQPGAPFFPAAYHMGKQPAFGIATEAADLAVDAFTDAKSVDAGRKALTRAVEKHGKKLAKIAATLHCKFYGVDFSLAPFPDDAHSLGNAVEKMGIPKIGLHGSLAAAAILTEAVDRANFPHTGFSGFMQPILEDSVLAQRAADGVLTIKDILLYSAVCGTGLDTIPLPGDTTAEQLVPLLLDLSALALRLNKPLTARLMPIPGKQAGDETNFDFGFFKNSKVLKLESEPLHAPMLQNETLQIKQRNS